MANAAVVVEVRWEITKAAASAENLAEYMEAAMAVVAAALAAAAMGWVEMAAVAMVGVAVAREAVAAADWH